MTCLFDTPIRTRKVRDGVIAEVYRTGIITIAHMKYGGYTLAQAISEFRKSHPARKGASK